MTPDKGQKDAGQSCIGWKDMTLPWVSDKLYMATSMSFLDPAALLANKSEAIHVIKLVGSEIVHPLPLLYPPYIREGVKKPLNL